MSRLPPRPPLGQKAPKPERGAAGKRHMARVAELPCMVCGAWPVHVHHCIHGRYGQRKASDMEVIPLCPTCHQHGPQSIHRDKRRWSEMHGPDYEMLPRVEEMLRQRFWGDYAKANGLYY